MIPQKCCQNSQYERLNIWENIGSVEEQPICLIRILVTGAESTTTVNKARHELSTHSLRHVHYTGQPPAEKQRWIWRYHLDRWPATQTWPFCPLACPPPSIPQLTPPAAPPPQLKSRSAGKPQMNMDANHSTDLSPNSTHVQTDTHTPLVRQAYVCYPLNCLWRLWFQKWGKRICVNLMTLPKM